MRLAARVRPDGRVTGCKGMIAVVRRTGHSSYYVEKGMNAMGKTQKELGIQTDYRISGGGKFTRSHIGQSSKFH